MTASAGKINVGGAGGGGSNIVSRDDTAAMHRLIARWLHKEVGRLVDMTTNVAASPVDKGRAMRAIIHSFGILTVFFRYDNMCL